VCLCHLIDNPSAEGFLHPSAEGWPCRYSPAASTSSAKSCKYIDSTCPPYPSLRLAAATRAPDTGASEPNRQGRRNSVIVSPIQPCALPEQALLRKYARGGAYTDCYATEVARPVSHAEYVEAFYTTGVFRLERLLLAWFVSKPSTDVQARQLATGARNSFAAWSVEERTENQLLMSDFKGRTRSWLMVAPLQSGGSATTCLYFGSAVVPILNDVSGQTTLGFSFRVLLGFHKLYSRVLLRAASSRLARSRLAEHRGPT